MTQKQIIFQYLKQRNEWVRAYELRSKNTQFGWIGFQGDRRARELAHDNVIERRERDGYAEYHYKEQIIEPPLIREKEQNRLLIEAMK